MDAKKKNLQVSSMAETLIGSEIIQLAWQINDKISKGQMTIMIVVPGRYREDHNIIEVN